MLLYDGVYYFFLRVSKIYEVHVSFGQAPEVPVVCFIFYLFVYIIRADVTDTHTTPTWRWLSYAFQSVLFNVVLVYCCV